jgi:hypothetical protein
MTGDLAPSPLLPARAGGLPVPALIAAAGEKASEHFLEFFAATISKPVDSFVDFGLGDQETVDRQLGVVALYCSFNVAPNQVKDSPVFFLGQA